jgi:DNA-binding CsgD family transcriptional regulator
MINVMKSKSTIKSENHQIPAGLITGDKRTEIFGNTETKLTYFITDGRTYSFSELSGEKKAQIFEKLLNDEVALNDLKHLPLEEAIEKFAFCNYGSANNEGDFTEKGVLQKTENFQCGENCICLKWDSKKIKVDGNPLTPKELKVITLLASDLPDKKIAFELNITVSTLNTHKANLFEKFSVQSKSGLITKAFQQKII